MGYLATLLQSVLIHHNLGAGQQLSQCIKHGRWIYDIIPHYPLAGLPTIYTVHCVCVPCWHRCCNCYNCCSYMASPLEKTPANSQRNIRRSVKSIPFYKDNHFLLSTSSLGSPCCQCAVPWDVVYLVWKTPQSTDDSDWLRPRL